MRTRVGWLLACWLGGVLGAEPKTHWLTFDVYPSYATVSLSSGSRTDQYAAQQRKPVVIFSQQITVEIKAPGWESRSFSVLANQLQEGEVWPGSGPIQLKPASFKAYLESIPIWLVFSLLPWPGLAWLWHTRRRRSPEATSESQDLPVDSLPWELPLASKVKQYTIEERLGEGASGVVYRVSENGTQLALKLLKPNPVEGQENLARFRREMISMRELRHPNIPFLADFGEFRGMSFLVMELLGSVTLRARLDQGPLDPPKALEVLKKLVQALSFCHSRGILHRDIKPENVVWGDGERIRLTDFGLARHHNASTLTQEGAIMGTPSYIAPEVCRGERASAASDQYSLGCLAYAMLAGDPPFHGDNALAVVMMHLMEAPPPLTQAPPQLAAIVMKMLEKDPAERYPDLESLLKQLESLQL